MATGTPVKIRPGAGDHEKWAVQQWEKLVRDPQKGVDPLHSVLNQINDSVTLVLREHGFFPNGMQPDADTNTIKFIDDRELKRLADDHHKAQKLVGRLKDLELGAKAVKALSMTNEENYWNARMFNEEGVNASSAKSAIVQRLLEGEAKKAGKGRGESVSVRFV